MGVGHLPAKRWLGIIVGAMAAVCLMFAAWLTAGASAFAGLQPAAARPRRLVRLMAAIPPGSPILCIGRGPVFLLTAKTAASMGHPTTIVTQEAELYAQLLWGEESPLQTLTMVGVDEPEAFDAAVAAAKGLVICYDQPEEVLSEKLLNVVVGAPERVALLSRHLNGLGNGALCAAAKGAANADVWVASPQIVDAYRDFEKRVKARVNDVVTVRAGTLKGGGPGDAASAEAKVGGSPTLSYGFYKQGQQDVVNWRLLFDCDTNGVALTPGDTARGPGWKAILAATSPEVETGDSSRVAVAQALVRALGVEGLQGMDFGVETRKARVPPTDQEWDALFANLLAAS